MYFCGISCSVSFIYDFILSIHVAQMVNKLPTVLETWIWPLGQDDPLEKGMASHSNILAWRIPWTEEPGGLQSMGSQRVRWDWASNKNFHKKIEKKQKQKHSKRFVNFVHLFKKSSITFVDLLYYDTYFIQFMLYLCYFFC